MTNVNERVRKSQSLNEFQTASQGDCQKEVILTNRMRFGVGALSGEDKAQRRQKGKRWPEEETLRVVRNSSRDGMHLGTS